MSKGITHNKYCNCSISSDKDILKPNINHSYCSQCGSILIKETLNKIYYTIKPKQKIKKIEFNPIDIIISMKNKTDSEFPYLNNEFNINHEDTIIKENVLKSINIYLKHRKLIILTLQKFMKMLDYTDLVFYQCLFYMDIILSHHIIEDISEKTVLYYLVGYFLCSAKLRETDIYEPSLNVFSYPYKNIFLSVEKISEYEVNCLQSIKYNVFSYSVYDWINELTSIGIVFDCEINKDNSVIIINKHRHSIINIINKNILKLLLILTIKDIFFKFSPMHIAFSLIQLSREEYLDKNVIRPDLFNNLINLYGINFNDYKKCYQEIKEEIENKTNEINNHSEKEKKLDNNDNHENFVELNKIKNDDYKCDNGKEVIVNNKLKESLEFSFLIRGIENNKIVEKPYIDTNNKYKEENIIFYNKKNGENNNALINDSNLNIMTSKDFENMKNNETKLLLKNSKNITFYNIKNKKKLYLNCNTTIYKSENNLPKLNFHQKLEEPSLNHSNKKRNKNKENLYNLKNLNHIKTQNITNHTINNRYNQNDYSPNKYFLKQKEELISMSKIFFYDNPNIHKNNNETNNFNNELKKIRAGDALLVTKLKLPFKENNNELIFKEKINNKEEQSNRYKGSQSKIKIKNNPIGKQVKAYMMYKRHLSTDFKKKILKAH